MNNDPLNKFFNFDEVDLNANRNGILSQKQQERLMQNFRSGKKSSLGCGFFFFVVASIVPVVMVWMYTTQREDILVFDLMYLFFGLIWGVAWGTIGVVIIRSAFKKPDLTLASVEGPINIVGVERRSGGKTHTTYIAHELHIGGLEFDVKGDLADMMMQGDVYAIYYLKNGNMDTESIMSLEYLSKGK